MIGKVYLDSVQTPVVGVLQNELGAIFQTSLSEAFEFFWAFFDDFQKETILVVPLIPAVAFNMAISAKSVRNRRISYGIPVVAALFILNIIPSHTGSLISIITSGYNEYCRNVSEFTEIQNKRAMIGEVHAVKQTTGETYVLVIGESANHDHMSAYGYFRPTTPWLESKLASPNWIFFRHGYASYCHTIPSLMYAMTQANQYNHVSPNAAHSLIEVFNAAGFDTYWISEQGQAIGDTPLNVIARSSKTLLYVKPGGAIKGELKKALQKMDFAKNNLIIINLAGSHADYRKRFPANYEVNFADPQHEIPGSLNNTEFVTTLLDPYDKSIHYTDQLMSELYTTISSAAGTPSMFAYFSDHGEDVIGRKFHNASLFTYPMVRIPLVMGFSNAWIEQNKEKFSILKNRTESIFTLDTLFETMLGIGGITGFDYDTKYDFSHANYAIDETNALTMTAYTGIDKGLFPVALPRLVREDSRLIARNNIKNLNETHSVKFLSLRNDTKGAVAKSYYLGYAGVELNVTIPPMLIGHYHLGVVHDYSLADYLKDTDLSRFRLIWFDAKTMEGYDVASALSKFKELDRSWHIKDKSIIESWDSGLAAFSEAGWHTSYYLHERNWPESNGFKENSSMYATKIAEVIKNTKAKSLSFNYSHYPFVKQYLDPILPPEIKYNIFAIPAEMSVYNKNLPRVVSELDIMKDPRVNTILLNEHLFNLDG